MKKTILFFIPLLAAFALLTSCGSETTESGIEYKFIVQNEDSAKPAQGDYLFYKLKIKFESNDSTFFNSDDTSDGRPMPIVIEPLTDPKFDGDYMEILDLMHVGDSVVAKFDIDTFFVKLFGTDSLPKNVEHGSKVVMEIKLDKYMTKDKYKAFAKKMQDDIAKKKSAQQDKEIAAYMAKNSLIATPTATGLYYIETQKGSGKKVENGKVANVKYKGSFLSGEVFDSSELHGGEPMQVPVGKHMVIPGWEEALLLMSEGSKAKIIVPFQIAYGPRGMRPAIPPYTPLVFELEVTKVDNEMKAPEMGGMPSAPEQGSNVAPKK